MASGKKPSVVPVVTYATLPRTVRGMPLVLSGDPKGKNFLYTNNTSVIIRDIAHPENAEIVTKHPKAVNVAKYCPSGFYIASGDDAGKVMIWDTVNKEHILKYEYQPIGGAIKDLAWDPESKRLTLCGEGRERFAAAISWDTGTSLGNLTGNSKKVNSIDFKQTRPFRCVTASEDFSVQFYEGVPFKHSRSIRDHGNFVNAVRFSPNGEVFVSGGGDKKAFLYDGKTGEKMGEFQDPSLSGVAHNGSIYALSFNGDGQKVLTVSGDKTAKIWDVQTQQIVTTFNMGSDLKDMQQGCLWQGDYVLTVSLSGFINYLDVNNPDKPLRSLKGTNKPITTMSLSADKSEMYFGTMDADVGIFNCESFEDDRFQGTSHKNQIMDMVIDGDMMVTVAIDDTIIFSNVKSKTFGEKMSLDSQPHGVDSKNGKTVVACINHIVVFENGKKLFSQKVNFQPKQVSISPSGEVAVGCVGDQTVRVFNISSGGLTEVKSIKQTDNPNDVEFSPNGKYLATAGDARNVRCYELPSYEEVFDKAVHNARVNCISWSPDSEYFVTGGLDTNINLWWPEKGFNNNASFKGAHLMNQITKARWLNENTFFTCSQDSCVKKWRVE